MIKMAMHEQYIVACCGECCGAFGADDDVFCDLDKDETALDREALWGQHPPGWCPLRKKNYVLETVLSSECRKEQPDPRQTDWVESAGEQDGETI